MRLSRLKIRCLFTLLALTSGTLLQTSCSTVAVDALTGVATAASTQLIRRAVYDLFNVSPSGAALLGGLGS